MVLNDFLLMKYWRLILAFMMGFFLRIIEASNMKIFYSHENQKASISLKVIISRGEDAPAQRCLRGC